MTLGIWQIGAIESRKRVAPQLECESQARLRARAWRNW